MRYRFPRMPGNARWGVLFRRLVGTVGTGKCSGDGMKSAVDGETGESPRSPKTIDDVVRRIESQHEILQHHLKVVVRHRRGTGQGGRSAPYKRASTEI